MAPENILEELKARQIEYGLSLSKLAFELGVTQPYLTIRLTARSLSDKSRVLDEILSITITAALGARGRLDAL